MTSPAQARIAAASRLDHARNADALGAARERCLPDAVARIVPVLVAAPVRGSRAAAVRPYLRRLRPTGG